jgi:hypothetical protein
MICGRAGIQRPARQPARVDLREVAEQVQRETGLRVKDVDALTAASEARPPQSVDPNRRLRHAPKMDQRAYELAARQAAMVTGARIAGR